MVPVAPSIGTFGLDCVDDAVFHSKNVARIWVYLQECLACVVPPYIDRKVDETREAVDQLLVQTEESTLDLPELH